MVILVVWLYECFYLFRERDSMVDGREFVFGVYRRCWFVFVFFSIFGNVFLVVFEIMENCYWVKLIIESFGFMV